MKSDQLSKLRKENGVVLKAVVTKLIVELSKLKSCNADADTMVFWAEMVISSYWHLKIDDIILAFKMGINKKFGKNNWAKLDYDCLSGWLDLYDKQKEQVCTNIGDQKQIQHKHTTEEPQRRSEVHRISEVKNYKSNKEARSWDKNERD